MLVKNMKNLFVFMIKARRKEKNEMNMYINVQCEVEKEEYIPGVHGQSIRKTEK